MATVIVNNISFAYKKGNPIFKGLSFKIENKNNSGYVCSIMGESGSGKTTLLNLLLDILKPHSGGLKVGCDNSVFSYLPQVPVLFEHLTPLENAEYLKEIPLFKKRFDSNLFNELAQILGLEDILKKNKIYELSGGEKQRIALLRAVCVKPDFLFLDEPCTGLDEKVKIQFLIKLKEIIEKYNLFVIYVSHSKEEVKLISDDLIYLVKDSNNCITNVVKDSVKDFLNNPKCLDAGYVFNAPEANILKCKIENGNILPASGSDDSPTILFNANNVSVAKNGFKYILVSNSDIYSYIYLEDFDEIIVINNNHKIKDVGKIEISGKCFIYSPRKLLEQSFIVNRNKIEK